VAKHGCWTRGWIFSFVFLLTGLSGSGAHAHETDVDDVFENLEHFALDLAFPTACRAASSAQLSAVNRGNEKATLFLQRCASETGGSPWCEQLVRPNPASAGTFRCTYGALQPHMLIHPDPATWTNAFRAARMIAELEAKNIKVCLVYNWWRPEPYNANVGGAPGRHPFGTSVDVRFCSMADMERGFLQLCKWRAAGRLRAVGYYGTTGIHFGIGDANGNTWGKSCPSFSPLPTAHFMQSLRRSLSN
jgi:hypothetical protein